MDERYGDSLNDIDWLRSRFLAGERCILRMSMEIKLLEASEAHLSDTVLQLLQAADAGALSDVAHAWQAWQAMRELIEEREPEIAADCVVVGSE